MRKKNRNKPLIYVLCRPAYEPVNGLILRQKNYYYVLYIFLVFIYDALCT